MIIDICMVLFLPKTSMQWFPSLTLSAMKTIALTFLVEIVGFGGVESNPGPSIPAPKCAICDKTARKNQQRFLYEMCQSFTHACYINPQIIDNKSINPHLWTCTHCLHHHLPYRNVIDLNLSIDSVYTMTPIEQNADMSPYVRLCPVMSHT